MSSDEVSSMTMLNYKHNYFIFQFEANGKFEVGPLSVFPKNITSLSCNESYVVHWPSSLATTRSLKSNKKMIQKFSVKVIYSGDDESILRQKACELSSGKLTVDLLHQQHSSLVSASDNYSSSDSEDCNSTEDGDEATKTSKKKTPITRKSKRSKTKTEKAKMLEIEASKEAENTISKNEKAMSKLTKKTKKQEERKQLSKGVYASLHSLSQDNDPEQHDAADCVEEDDAEMLVRIKNAITNSNINSPGDELQQEKMASVTVDSSGTITKEQLDNLEKRVAALEAQAIKLLHSGETYRMEDSHHYNQHSAGYWNSSNPQPYRSSCDFADTTDNNSYWQEIPRPSSFENAPLQTNHNSSYLDISYSTKPRDNTMVPNHSNFSFRNPLDGPLTNRQQMDYDFNSSEMFQPAKECTTPSTPSLPRPLPVKEDIVSPKPTSCNPTKFPIDVNVAKSIFNRVGKKTTLFVNKLMDYLYTETYLKTHKMTEQRKTSSRVAADPDEIRQIIECVMILAPTEKECYIRAAIRTKFNNSR